MQKRRRATESSINHSSNTYSGLQRKRSSFGQFIKNNTSKRDPDNNKRASTGSSGITTKGVLNNDLLSMMPGVQNELRQSQQARRHSMIDPRTSNGGRGFMRKFLERQWSSK